MLLSSWLNINQHRKAKEESMIVFDFKLPRIEIIGLWEDADTVKGCRFFEYRVNSEGLDREIWLGRLQIIISSTRPRVTPSS